MNDQKNLLLALLFSAAIYLGFHYFYELPKAQQAAQQAAQQTSQPATSPQNVPQPEAIAALKTREEVLKEGERAVIQTPKLHGSINLKGARLDDLTLATYHETVDPKSSEITLLSPKNTKDAYYADFGWVSSDPSVVVPNEETLWQADEKELTPSNPLHLSWDNGQGLLFEKTIMIDANYMFTVTQKVTNKTKNSITLYPYGLISRSGTPATSDYYILHEGPLGVLNGKLFEKSYKDVLKEGKSKLPSKGGWLGITDKYWLTALIPDPHQSIEARFSAHSQGTTPSYQTDYLSEAQTLTPGQSLETVNRLFAGAKVVELLDGYEETLNIQNFDLAVDFGWFYIITKPMFYTLNFLHQLLGNFGLSIIALTLLLKLFFFPLANKSYRSMARMKAFQPEIEKIKKRYADDRLKMNEEMMALYKKHKINPVSGCLPMVIQIPVFFGLYKVLFVTLEMRHAPFYGWLKDLSAPDPTSLFNLFGLISWDPPSFLHIGILPLLMGLSMFMQQRLNPQPADPIQAKMFLFMPLFFTFLLAQFPSGLVLYWTWNNVLTILQQWIIMRSTRTSKA